MCTCRLRHQKIDRGTSPSPFEDRSRSRIERERGSDPGGDGGGVKNTSTTSEDESEFRLSERRSRDRCARVAGSEESLLFSACRADSL